MSTVQQFTLMVILLVVNIINDFFPLYNDISIYLKNCLLSLYGHVQIRGVNIFHWKKRSLVFFFCMIFQCPIGIFKTKLSAEKEGIKTIDLILLYLFIYMNTIYTSGSLWFLCNSNQGRQLCWNVSYRNKEKRGFFSALIFSRVTNWQHILLHLV